MSSQSASAHGIVPWKCPHSHDADYLKRIKIPIGVTNHCDAEVRVDAMQLRFQSENSIDGTALAIHHECRDLVIRPGASEYDNVELVPSILFAPSTNYYAVELSYRFTTGARAGQKQKAGFSNHDYLIIHDPPRSPGRKKDYATVFVSFKDPADLPLANIAKALCTRAGLEPYLARDESRVGSDWWREKIRPEIVSADGMIVIWTAFTATAPGVVREELRCALEVGTPVGVFREQDVDLPAEYAADRKEHLQFDRGSPWIPFARAIEAAAKRCRGGREVFS
jgi:hypothetical protein